MRAHHASDNLSHAAVKMGLTQWAYWSAEYDEFHSEEEAREELRSIIAE